MNGIVKCFQISQNEVVIVIDERIENRVELLRIITVGKHGGIDGIEYSFDIFRILVNFARIVVHATFSDLFFGKSEQIKVFCAHGLANFDVGTV